MKYEPFIYGKDQTEFVTSVDVLNGDGILYLADGSELTVSNDFYILYPSNYTGNFIRLDGDLYYKWAEKCATKAELSRSIGQAKAQGWDYFTIYNPVESFLVKSGVTYYKGMKPSDLKVLSFDIETTGLDPNTNEILMISNTFRNGDKIERRLFSVDEFNSEKEMIYAWSNFVVDRDPSVLVGHNILGFDLPFIKRRAGKIPIGKMCKSARFATKPSQFRKDGSQSYEYTNILVPGREIVDTFHLALKYDIGRNYPSYGLKAIIEHEGLEKSGRVFWDFLVDGKMSKDMSFEKWEKAKAYCSEDGDDSLALFDLMIPPFFYYCQHIPKTMQQIVNSATGSQINSFMVRAYLSEGHSLPQKSEPEKYKGGISFGHPGIYEYVAKVDVASLYPSIILQYGIYDKQKDPKKYFLQMVEYFTNERLKNKQLSKTTEDRYYKDLEQAQKIVINSAYGFMGAPGLLFNSPQSAARVTQHGRDILQKGIYWADKKQWDVINADTDSFSFSTGNRFPPGVFKEWITELNELFPEKIRWEDDGTYTKMIVVKAKNYVLQSATDGKITLKGSALKATMKEPALKEFINKIIMALLEDKNADVRSIYQDYVGRIHAINGDTISSWVSKKTVTKSVLNPQRTNEARIKEAIQNAKKDVSEGDKIHVFFRTDESLALVESFDGVYSSKKLLGKLFKTAEILKPVVNMDYFPNLTLKRNKKLLDNIIDA